MRHLLCLFFYMTCLQNVTGDETVTLQEMEGTTITLHTGRTGIQSDAQIQWFYGPEKAEEMILNSQVFKGETVTEISERFKERLQLDRTSGALTIRNISRNHSGVYLLQVITGRISSRTFSVSVYAPVSSPNITGHSVDDHSASVPTSGSRCSVLCSVERHRDTTLSWFKGTEILNQTSDSHDANKLTLPLDVNVEEHDVYSCVSANPISNHTVTLNITEICSHHAGKRECCGFIELLIRSVCCVLVLAAISALLVHHFITL